MSRVDSRILAMVLLGLSYGCGGGGSSSAAGGSSAGSAGAQVPAPVPAPAVGRIVISSVLARAVPSRIDSLVFTGKDSGGAILYGPISRPKAATITLESVPVGVTTLEIEYFEGTILRGRGQQTVAVSSTRDTLLEDPPFSDVTYALTSLRVEPESLALERGQSRDLLVMGSYADNSTLDITSSAQWSSSNTSVAEIQGNQVLSRSLGNCTITSTVGNLSSQAHVQVTPPRLVGIRIQPLQSTLLEGGRLSYQALGDFSDSSQEPLTQVTWSSSAPSVADITPTGEAHALTPGQSLIQASSQNIVANTTLTVAVNQTLTHLTLTPSNLQIPKGLNAQYRVTASYANGTVVDLTDSATFSTADPQVAITAGGIQGYYPSAPTYDGSGLAIKPPPYFPEQPSMIGGRGLGTTMVRAQFAGLSAEVPVMVTPALPYGALATPVQTHVLQVGESVSLGSLTVMSDGTQENNRTDVQIAVASGNSTSLNAQSLLTAVRAGIDFLKAVVPPLPALPSSTGARYTYAAGGAPPQADYSRAPYDETVAVVNQPLGIDFTVQANPAIRRGSLIEASPGGIVGAIDQGNALTAPYSVTLPRTYQLRAIGGGNFSGEPQLQVFFGGRRTSATGSDYGVLLSPQSGGFSPTPARFVEFQDAPGGVQDALVADFDGNGRSDVALVHDQQLRVRLSSAGPLDNLRFVANLGTGVSEVAQGDFNEDSKIDLVVGRWDGIQIFTGDGSGGFAPGPVVASHTPGALGMAHLTVGDIDGDGHLDVTYMTNKGLGNRYYVVAYGEGSGQLGRIWQGTTGFRVQATALADLTGDGRADLVTLQSKSQYALGSATDASVSIHPGSAQGFGPQQVIQLANNRSGADLLVQDLNGDGRLDLYLALQTLVQGPGYGNAYSVSPEVRVLLRRP